MIISFGFYELSMPEGLTEEKHRNILVDDQNNHLTACDSFQSDGEQQLRRKETGVCNNRQVTSVMCLA